MTEPTFDITGTFTEEFFGGSAGPVVDDRSLPVGIGGRAFMLDLASEQFSRRSVQLLNSQQAESGKDGANVTPEVWRRSVESWHQGAAQDRYDREDALPSRYKASVGIDPWTKYRLGLLPDTTQLLALGASEGAILRSIGQTLFVILADEVQVYADATTSATHVDEVMTDPPVGATCDGENLYVLDDTGIIHRYNLATTTWNHAYATVAAFNPDKSMIAYVKGFLLVGNGPILLDYTNPGVPNTVDTHRLSGWHWKAACEGMTVIYILGGMGDRWHVCRVSIQTSGADLDPPIVAATLPEGEFAYTVASYLGYVLIGVHQGWRFALADSSGALTYGQVIRTPKPVRCFEGQGRFVWFGLSLTAADLLDPVMLREAVYTETAGLGRADLSTFVAVSTPAAASDLAAGGAVYGDTVDVVTVGGENDGLGLRVFAVKGTAAGGVYIESADLVASGWLRQGYASFNSADRKMGLYGQVFHEPLVGTIDIEVDVDNIDTFTGIGSNSNQGSTTMGNMAFTQGFNTIELKYVLTRSLTETTQTPVIKRTEFRAMNVPGRSTEWRIPILLVEGNQYRDVQFMRSVEDDYDYLMTLVQSRAPFTYREGEREWTLHAVDFLWQPTHMIADYSTYQGTFILVARETN